MVESRFASEQNVELHIPETGRETFTKFAVTHLLTSSWPLAELRAKSCFLLFKSDLCWVNWLHVGSASYQNTFRCCAGRHKNTWRIATIKYRPTWFDQLSDSSRNWATRIIEAVTALLFRVIDWDKHRKSLLFYTSIGKLGEKFFLVENYSLNKKKMFCTNLKCLGHKMNTRQQIMENIGLWAANNAINLIYWRTIKDHKKLNL